VRCGAGNVEVKSVEVRHDAGDGHVEGGDDVDQRFAVSEDCGDELVQ
jgi:hypothetical protein